MSKALPDAKLRMYVVSTEIDILVVAENAEGAKEIAAREFAHEITAVSRDDFTARVATYIPGPYDACDLPYGEHPNIADDMTVGEWLTHNEQAGQEVTHEEARRRANNR